MAFSVTPSEFVGWGGGVQGFREPMDSLHRLPVVSPSLTGLISTTEKRRMPIEGLGGVAAAGLVHHWDGSC